MQGGALFPGGKTLAVKQEVFLSLCNIYFPLLVPSTVLYSEKKSEALPIKNWTL